MANAKRDQNNVPVATAVLSRDSVSVVMLEADPTTHILDVDDNTTGTVSTDERAYRDSNYVPTLIAVSDTDGVTPVMLAVDINGNLLIDSN